MTMEAPPRGEPQGLRDVVDVVRRPSMAGSMWLVALPAIGFGTIGVLGPLRLADMGAGAAAVGATFLVAAVIEATVSPIVGRVADRRGAMVPIRIGLASAAVLLCLLTVPDRAVELAVLIVAITAALGIFWAPAMAVLSGTAESAGLHQSLAFGLSNLAWATGQMVGAAGGGAVAKATGDALPAVLTALLAVATLAALSSRRARASTP
jgi:predicted MFS family arabinose efflux permease